MSPPNEDGMEERRRSMVEDQLVARGIEDPGVLRAFRTIPREEFVDPQYRDRAYEDRALPTRSGQTISQPYMVAAMTEALEVEPDHSVLEIGTGSGYQTAILLEIGARVYTVEKYEELSRLARETLRELGYRDRVEFRVGDGSKGWPDHAPYDRVLVTAGAPKVPDALREQTRVGGRMVIPVGSRSGQQIRVLQRLGESDWDESATISCVFVPLTGEAGWDREEG